MTALEGAADAAVAPRDNAEDAGLVRLAQAGRAEARDELARRCRRPAYLLALQLVGNRDDALDISQDALVRFFATLGQLDGERVLRPWLCAIVRNQVRDFWRRRKLRRTEPLPLGAEEDERGAGLAALVDPHASPETEAAESGLRRAVWRAIERLPEAKREIVVLRDFHDLSYRELAQVLEIRQGTVMSRLHAARAALREQLDQDGTHV